jgi:hypothetical protein
MTAKGRWFAFALVALMVGVASHSHAQDYPGRFIRVIVGPGPDITARVFGAKITEVLGQQVWSSRGPAPAERSRHRRRRCGGRWLHPAAGERVPTP